MCKGSPKQQQQQPCVPSSTIIIFQHLHRLTSTVRTTCRVLKQFPYLVAFTYYHDVLNIVNGNFKYKHFLNDSRIAIHVLVFQNTVVASDLCINFSTKQEGIRAAQPYSTWSTFPCTYHDVLGEIVDPSLATGLFQLVVEPMEKDLLR